MEFLWLARRRRAQMVRAEQRDRRVVGEEGLLAAGGPFNTKTCGAGGAGDAVLVAGGGECARSLRWVGEHADRRGADRAEGVPDGAGPAVHRCDRAEVGEVQWEEGNETILKFP